MTQQAHDRLPAISDMTLLEKISLLSGSDFWRTREIPERGVPALKLSDGPNGVRGDLARSVPATAFPVGVCLGASWNPDLLAEIGRAIAVEAKEKGVHVVLGPTVNLQRTPIGGRNFECYSEDPYLTGVLGTVFVKSLQGEGIGACPKHFVANDCEFERHTINSVLDEKTLYGVYLLPFEMIVKQARPWTIMSAYNRINGIYASSHTELVVNTLKKTWGFDGVVISDWGAALETIPNALGGLDLEMPGPSKVWGKKLQAAVLNGEVCETVIDEKVERLFRLIERTTAQRTYSHGPEQGLDAPWKRELVRRAAADGMVLLKNEQRLLPLDPDFAGRIAVIGPNAARGQIMGGGSSSLNSHPAVHPLDGLRAAFPLATFEYAKGCRNNKYTPVIGPENVSCDSGKRPGFERRVYPNSLFEGEPLEVDYLPTSLLKLLDAFGSASSEPGGIVLEGDYKPDVAGLHTIGFMSAGKAKLMIDGRVIIDNWTNWKRGHSFYTFGSDEVRAEVHLDPGRKYRLRVEYERPIAALIAGVQFGIEPPLSKNSIADAAELAARSDVTILVLGSNADWETEGTDRALHGLPGEQDDLAEAVLNACPNTVVVMNIGSATEMPWYLKANSVLVTWFAGQEMGNALGDVLTGKSDPGGRLPFAWPMKLTNHPAMACYPGENGKMLYSEGIHIGYRGFRAHAIEPLAPFGFGLSYGDARITSAHLLTSKPNELLQVEVVTSNTSDRPSTIIVQAYAEVGAELGQEPLFALVSFEKLVLNIGETRSANLAIDLDLLTKALGLKTAPNWQGQIKIGTSASGPFIDLPIE